ncbi:MAG TPA: NAD-dependent epimerase/dehydratase family protein [Chloroflexi bacterium]|nr:NAD-dependent epimerase/dehydratase family protein [Chloroflexota bacterium]
MQVLVTGAAGFLGAALANTLAAQGHQVIGLDNMSTSSPNELSPNIHFTRGDINDRPKLWTLLQDVDCVYHLAARVLVPESVLYPAEYNLVNTGGTVNLMEAVRDAGVRRVVFISSGAIYGNQETQPLTEEALPNPKSPYAVSKLAAEYYVRTIGQLAGIESVCLRVFNAYGPGQQIPPSYTPVIPSFLKQALQKGTIVVHGSGSQTRDYVYVDDVVQAMITAGMAPDIDGEIINVGSGIETSILDLVTLVSQLADFEPEVIYNPRRGSGPTRMCACLKKAERLLGYQPRISLQEGLQRTIQLDTNLRTNGQNHH